jgi:hypothetical protein
MERRNNMEDNDGLKADQEFEGKKLIAQVYDGINRRATALLPPPSNAEQEKIDLTGHADFRKLFLAIEAKQQTGCLRIESEQERSRSGILIFRGRVLGCVYRNKRLDEYLFGEAAYRSALRDLAGSGRIVDGYLLPEDLATATAALFHGHVLEAPRKASATEIFEQSCGYLVESKMSGCIVLSSQDEKSICMVYLYRGRIIGIYSSHDGWLEPAHSTVEAYIELCELTKAQACILVARNQPEVLNYSFSLSRLVDRNVEPWAHGDGSTVPNIFYLCNHDSKILSMCDNVVPLDRFVPGRAASHSRNSDSSCNAINHVYRVNN